MLSLVASVMISEMEDRFTDVLTATMNPLTTFSRKTELVFIIKLQLLHGLTFHINNSFYAQHPPTTGVLNLAWLSPILRMPFPLLSVIALF